VNSPVYTAGHVVTITGTQSWYLILWQLQVSW